MGTHKNTSVKSFIVEGLLTHDDDRELWIGEDSLFDFLVHVCAENVRIIVEVLDES